MTSEISTMRDRCENLNLQLLDFKEAQNILIESNRGYQTLFKEQDDRYKKFTEESKDIIYELKHQIAQLTSDKVNSEHLAKQVLKLNEENKTIKEKLYCYDCNYVDIGVQRCGECVMCKKLEAQQKVKMLDINLADANKEIIDLSAQFYLYNCNNDKCGKCVMCRKKQLLEKVKQQEVLIKQFSDCGEKLINENTSLKTDNKLFQNSITEQLEYISKVVADNVKLETINDKMCRSKFILHTTLNRIKNNNLIVSIRYNKKIAAQALIDADSIIESKE